MLVKRRLLSFLLLLFIAILVVYKKDIKPVFVSGDILFQDTSRGDISKAIKKVTEDENNSKSFSHVGILQIDDKGTKFVLEAITEGGVSKTPFDTFLNRSLTDNGEPKVVVCRLKEKYRDEINVALEYGSKLIGYPYDNVYTIGDSMYYCSEYVYEMLHNTGEHKDIFKLNPMTFKDDDTGDYLPFWVKYYDSLNVDIPEGKLGLNPNGMYKSNNIDSIYSFY
ncbi:YiiX/YebB-like N1pC/P60 family cysteine hydrolase [Ichthyobacterium seriolicida]|uniref:Peptidoglycan peptidase n=1 Tax=Ichthyobacterium seriolicida TaxID=242600 RepID=A0A1J1DXU5_9FLAO|nr:YiiX/YebB-like N1pC/P60 family cysteine hydrolase [Ichthyobacterium seriolicida]BAV94695.1 hypothetical protein JBKA6_0682 [Ichthyobacterium seriolicida]